MRYTGRSVFVLTAATLAVGAAPAAAETVYGITAEATPSLVTFDSATPGTLTSDVEIAGVTGAIVGMDVRPATTQIVVLNDAGQFYEVDAFSGNAAPIGDPNATLTGAADIDFNPTVDRVRIVGQEGAAGGDGLGNARANPNTGAAVTPADGDLAFAAGDANAGDTPVVAATAYTNSFPASQTFPTAPTTTQFDLETGNDVLVRQAPPNDGTLNTVGPLGVDVVGGASFDVVTDADGTTNRAYAAFGVAGGTTTGLYTVDTGSGKATKVGDFARPVTEIAVAPVTPLLVGLANTTLRDRPVQALLPLQPDSPESTVGGTIVRGLPLGVELLGIDQRPADGKLYGLGSDSRIYTVDAISGQVAAVGSGPFTPALSGTTFGFDFNPVADRIRIVSDTGQNLRVNPTTGAGTGTTAGTAQDGALNGDTTSLTAAAYTNSVRPAPTTTQLFGLDTQAATQQFVQVTDPNAGPTRNLGPLRPAGSGLEARPIANLNGYDIAARFNQGFVLDEDGLLAVNVASGASGVGSAVEVLPIDFSDDVEVVGLAAFDTRLLEPVPAVTPPAATPTPTPTGGTPTTPPATTPAAKVRSRISYSVSPRRDRRAPYRYTLRGRIVPRGTAAANAFDGGRLTVRAKRSGTTRTLVTRTARVTSTGRFTLRVTVPKRTLKRRGGVVRLNLRFNGTDALFPSRAFPRARYR